MRIMLLELYVKILSVLVKSKFFLIFILSIYVGSNPTAEMPKISFSCGSHTSRRTSRSQSRPGIRAGFSIAPSSLLSAKSHACCTCSLVNARDGFAARYQLRGCARLQHALQRARRGKFGRLLHAGAKFALLRLFLSAAGNSCFHRGRAWEKRLPCI